MLIPATEFLQRATRHGLSRLAFKQSMVEMTKDTDPIDQLYRQGKSVYFAYDESFSYIKYFSAWESELPLKDNETYTDAFKLLKLIAD